MKTTAKYLVAECGSTKTDWVIFDDKDQSCFSSCGLNPLTMDRDFIAAEIQQTLSKNIRIEDIRSLSFYGAGCKNKTGHDTMSSIFRTILPGHLPFEIFSDIHACARACCEGKEGIIAILGTGSHAAWSDGDNILHDIPSLGYLLGDEGSGNFMGKKIISLYVLGQLHQDLIYDFENTFTTSKENIITSIYKSQTVSKELGKYGKFVLEHKNHFQMENIIQEGLGLFIQQRISCYSNKNNFPVHACGKVAVVLQNELKEQLQRKGFTLGRVIEKPIDYLVDYHRHRLY